MPFASRIWAWGYCNPHPRELVRVMGRAARDVPETCCQMLTGQSARCVVLPVVGAAGGRPRRQGSGGDLQPEGLERQPGDRPAVRRVDLVAVDPRVDQLDPGVLVEPWPRVGRQ